MSEVAASALDGLGSLGEDHVSWLLVAANNFLRQGRSDRGTTLLELAGLLAPESLQARKMLAWACWLEGDLERCVTIVEHLLAQDLSGDERAAMEVLQRRLSAGPRGAQR